MALLEILPAEVVNIRQDEFVDMLLRLCNDPSWLMERKYDGYRCIAAFDGQSVKLKTKSGRTHMLPKDFNRQLLGLFTNKGIASLILDGEIVGFDRQGRENFYFIKRQDGIRKLFAFDLLYLDGFDLRHLPLRERKGYLKSLIKGIDPAGSLTEYVSSVDDPAQKTQLALDVYQSDLEGVILKHAQSVYGDKTRPWYKFKNKGYSQYRQRWRMFQSKAGKKES